MNKRVENVTAFPSKSIYAVCFTWDLCVLFYFFILFYFFVLFGFVLFFLVFFFFWGGVVDFLALWICLSYASIFAKIHFEE